MSPSTRKGGSAREDRSVVAVRWEERRGREEGEQREHSSHLLSTTPPSAPRGGDTKGTRLGRDVRDSPRRTHGLCTENASRQTDAQIHTRLSGPRAEFSISDIGCLLTLALHSLVRMVTLRCSLVSHRLPVVRCHVDTPLSWSVAGLSWQNLVRPLSFGNSWS